jgi:hypothetical protein
VESSNRPSSRLFCCLHSSPQAIGGRVEALDLLVQTVGLSDELFAFPLQHLGTLKEISKTRGWRIFVRHDSGSPGSLSGSVGERPD